MVRNPGITTPMPISMPCDRLQIKQSPESYLFLNVSQIGTTFSPALPQARNGVRNTTPLLLVAIEQLVTRLRGHSLFFTSLKGSHDSPRSCTSALPCPMRFTGT